MFGFYQIQKNANKSLIRDRTTKKLHCAKKYKKGKKKKEKKSESGCERACCPLERQMRAVCCGEKQNNSEFILCGLDQPGGRSHKGDINKTFLHHFSWAQGFWHSAAQMQYATLELENTISAWQSLTVTFILVYWCYVATTSSIWVTLWFCPNKKS